MAATRLIALHVNKGKTLEQSLRDRTDYAKNPEKTRKGELVTSYSCDPMTVEEEFLLSRRQYQHTHGFPARHEIIAYQIRQSFKPGEIEAEEANRLGQELAQRFTKGEYAYIVATHTDKAHIHNHIVFNAISIDGSKKFRDFFLSGRALQRLSDVICLENGLSVIEPMPYEEQKKRTTYPQKASKREMLCEDLDSVLKRKPKEMSALIRMMGELGYEFKEGAHLAFRGKDAKRFIRLDSLPEGHREADIRRKVSGKEAVHRKEGPKEGVSLIIDIQSRMEGKGPGYEKWAKKFNLKQMAKSLLYLRDHGIDSLEDLDQRVRKKTEQRDQFLSDVKASETRLAEIATLKTHIINYVKTRETYSDYRKAGYSKKYLEAHREEIQVHKAAKQAFDELGMKKIPKVKELNEEYARVLFDKKTMYADYRKVRDELKELLTVQKNVESLYAEEPQEKRPEVKKGEKNR